MYCSFRGLSCILHVLDLIFVSVFLHKIHSDFVFEVAFGQFQLTSVEKLL